MRGNVDLQQMIPPEKYWEWFVDTLKRMQEKAASEETMPSRAELIKHWAAANDLQLLISRTLGPEFAIK